MMSNRFEIEIEALMYLDGVERDQAVKMLDLHGGGKVSLAPGIFHLTNVRLLPSLGRCKGKVW